MSKNPRVMNFKDSDFVDGKPLRVVNCKRAGGQTVDITKVVSGLYIVEFCNDYGAVTRQIEGSPADVVKLIRAELWV